MTCYATCSLFYWPKIINLSNWFGMWGQFFLFSSNKTHDIFEKGWNGCNFKLVNYDTPRKQSLTNIWRTFRYFFIKKKIIIVVYILQRLLRKKCLSREHDISGQDHLKTKNQKDFGSRWFSLVLERRILKKLEFWIFDELFKWKSRFLFQKINHFIFFSEL